MKKYSFIIAIFLATGIAAVAYASILFTGILTVSNNGTAASEVCTIFSINASYLQDVYGVDDEFDNVKILNSAGENVTFMPGYGTNPWLIFVPSIGEYTTTNYEFHTGNASLDGKKAIFLDDSMTITDDLTMECGDNFTMTFTDYYISGNQTWVQKTDAYSLVTSSGNITFSVTGNGTLTAPIIDGEHDIEISSYPYSYNEQLTGTYQRRIYDGSHTAQGIMFYAYAGEAINYIQFYLVKNGTPTGNARVVVRNWDDHTEIGELGTIDVSTITYGYYEFSSPVSISSTGNISITFEYSEVGSNYDNSPGISYTEPSVLSDFEAVRKITNWAIITDTEMRFKLSMNRTALFIDGELSQYSTTENTTIPDTASDLVIYAPYYIGGYNLAVDGTDTCTIEWNYGATLTDLSGNGNDATPTFRATSSDADVSAELTEYLPYAEADAEAVPIGYGTIFDEAPEQPETAYSENTSPGIFFAPALNAIIDITPIPRSFFWYNFAFCIIILSGMVTWRIHQSLILKAIVMTAFMILFALPGINIYGMYTVIYFSFFNFGLIVMSRSYGL